MKIFDLGHQASKPNQKICPLSGPFGSTIISQKCFLKFQARNPFKLPLVVKSNITCNRRFREIAIKVILTHKSYFVYGINSDNVLLNALNYTIAKLKIYRNKHTISLYDIIYPPIFVIYRVHQRNCSIFKRLSLCFWLEFLHKIWRSVRNFSLIFPSKIWSG